MRKKQLTLAMLTSVLRSHQQRPLQYFKNIRVIHLYSKVGSDMSRKDIDQFTIRHRGLVDLFIRLYKSNPDIIQGVETYSLPGTIHEFIAGYIYSLIFNKPLICAWLSNIPPERRYGKFLGKILKVINKIYTKKVGLYFYYSDLAKKCCLEENIDKKKLVYNIWAIWGPDLEQFNPKPKPSDSIFNNPTIVFIGSLEEHKGIKDLLNAFLIIKDKKPKVNLVIIGEGRLRPYIETFIKKYALTNSIKLLGAVKNEKIPGYLRAATIFALPSVSTQHLEEQMGLSNIQSMACNTPVVTTNCGGIPEFVENNITGLVVPQKNPKMLANDCLKLLNNPKLRRKIAIAGRKYVERKFDPQKNIIEAEKIIINWYKGKNTSVLKAKKRNKPIVNFITGPSRFEGYGLERVNHLITSSLNPSFHFHRIEYKPVFPFNLPLLRNVIRYFIYPLIVLGKTKYDSPLHITTQNFAFLLSFIPAKYKILTCHDITPYLFPEKNLLMRAILRWNYQSIAKADKIICDSKNTQKDLQRYLKIPPKKIIVAYPLVGEEFFLRKTAKSLNLPAKFVLYVGSYTQNKNLATLFKAFSKSFKTHKINLVVVNRKKNLPNQLKRLLADLAIERSVVFTDYLTDKQLSSVYQLASALVLPSFYEGFGYPVVEAMASGCPVITCLNSSLREVVGRAAYFVKPTDITDLSQAINQILTNKKLAARLKNLGIKQARQFRYKSKISNFREQYRDVYKEAFQETNKFVAGAIKRKNS